MSPSSPLAILTSVLKNRSLGDKFNPLKVFLLAQLLDPCRIPRHFSQNLIGPYSNQHISKTKWAVSILTLDAPPNEFNSDQNQTHLSFHINHTS